MTDDRLFLGKRTSQGGMGRWHVFESEDAGSSVCGAEREYLNQQVGLKSFKLEDVEGLEEVSGLGRVCKHCREYVLGCLNDRDLPKPERKRFAGNNLIQKWQQK